MVLQPLAKVGHADKSVDNRQDDQDNRHDGESRQTASHGEVVRLVGLLVNPDKLEEEVGQAGKVEADDGHHPHFDLAAGEEGGAEEDGDGDGNGGYGEGELDVGLAGYDDEELDCEAEEEEEVELEEGNVNLSMLEGEKDRL